MADRLTELQNVINQQAENLCNALGVLQQTAQPTYFGDLDRVTPSPAPSNQPDLALDYAKGIRATAQQIDYLICSLPEKDTDARVYIEAMDILDKEYREGAELLYYALQQHEETLQKVQSALADIAQTQLKAQALEASVYLDFLKN